MNILIVCKHSKLEWDTKRSELSTDELINSYPEEIKNRIIESHQHQLNVRKWIEKHFQNTKFITLDQFCEESANYKFDPADLVISVGGDNSFTSISSYLRSASILGLTADPSRSVGYLNSVDLYSEEDVALVKEKIFKYDYNVEDWTRAECKLEYLTTPMLATSEIFIGSRYRTNMSRHIMKSKSGTEEVKCSGLLVSTGAGSTGWYSSTTNHKSSFGRTKKRLEYIETEFYSGKHLIEPPKQHTCAIEDSEEIVVKSLNSEGIINCDSWRELDFRYGKSAKIKIGKSLSVIELNE